MTKDFNNKKILVVDDTAFLRTSLIKDLVEMGFNKNYILECENGKLAYDFLVTSATRAERFDLVLCDWNMPRLNGLDLLKLVRSSDQYFSTIPFVLITTVSEKEKIVEALKYQVTSYIIKPVMIKKLKETIDRIFT
jgi:two-component system chemotaxis response regulator CheY